LAVASPFAIVAFATDAARQRQRHLYYMMIAEAVRARRELPGQRGWRGARPR
jgi:hypothetical protein